MYLIFFLTLGPRHVEQTLMATSASVMLQAPRLNKQMTLTLIFNCALITSGFWSGHVIAPSILSSVCSRVTFWTMNQETPLALWYLWLSLLRIIGSWALHQWVTDFCDHDLCQALGLAWEEFPLWRGQTYMYFPELKKSVLICWFDVIWYESECYVFESVQLNFFWVRGEKQRYLRCFLLLFLEACFWAVLQKHWFLQRFSLNNFSRKTAKATNLPGFNELARLRHCLAGHEGHVLSATQHVGRTGLSFVCLSHDHF